MWITLLILFLSLLVISIAVAPVRRLWITPAILRYFRRTLPPISATEQAAIDAGDVLWVKELFSGKPNWQHWLTHPAALLSQEEQTFIDQQAMTLCSLINDWQMVQVGVIAPQVWDYIKQQRFLGLVIKKEYGGLGFSAYAHSCVISLIASRSISVAVSVMVPNSLGPAELIERYGTQEQKKYYLPRLVGGEEIPAFGLTSPEVGSDAAAMVDHAIVCYRKVGQDEVLGLVLNWNKRYITLAPMATVLALAVKLYDPEHLLGGESELGITLCLVPTHTKGVEIGKHHKPLNLFFPNGPTRGVDVFVPLDAIIGGLEKRGQGWKMMMESLAVGRGISLPALTSAITKLCFRGSSAYSQLRKQFRTSIGDFEGIQQRLAEIGGYTYLSEATRAVVAATIDRGERPALATAIAKYQLSEMHRLAINAAMDIAGGYGIQMGPRNYLAIPYCAAPIGITVEGANILTRSLIIYGQGAIRCHPYILREIIASGARGDSANVLEFDQCIWQHAGFALRNLGASIFYGLTGGCFINVSGVTGPLLPYCQQLTRMSTALACISDIALVKLGGEFKRREYLSARLADVLSYLYLASAVIKYYYEQQQPEEDYPFVKWALQHCLFHIGQSLLAFYDNFASPWIAFCLRRCTFFWGNHYRPPNDALSTRIAQLMATPGATRERITQFCYVANEEDKGLSLVEQAFTVISSNQENYRKLKQAIHTGKIAKDKTLVQQIEDAHNLGLIHEQEYRQLQLAEELRAAALQVDEF